MRSILLFWTLAAALWAEVSVVAAYPYIGKLAEAVGGEQVEVSVLAPGDRDPHFVVPRPSMIAKVRNADLVIMNGAGLEIGWLPPLLDRANNGGVRPGTSGFLDLSAHTELLGHVHGPVDRSGGDVHPEGNPHFAVDPHRVPALATAVKEALCALDGEHASLYRRNLNRFLLDWEIRLLDWDRKMAPLKGTKVVQYHALYDYLLERYGLIGVATLEPLPGIAPGPKHLLEVVRTVRQEKAAMILQDVYHDDDPARLVADKTGIPVVVIPHDVDAVDEAEDLASFYDAIVQRLAP